ncbi:MAG TPA: sensor histidine kinase [Candidatus Didemnitutus sp.]|nr:sensor histidine kinase [Candidatus Didemnitutus sp.]
MPRFRIFTLQLPAALHESVQAAGRLIPAPVTALGSSADLPVTEESSQLLDLVVAGHEAADIARLFAVQTDRGELPRCAALVVAPSPPAPTESIDPDEFVPTHLVRRLRDAARRLELQRDNLRLRGDLRTIARRYRHDLVAPVGSIHTSASVLESPPHEAATIALMVQNISESSREISSLIDRVSVVLRAIAEPKERIPVGMEPIVTAVLGHLAPEIDRREARVSLPSSWPVALGVPAWLEVMWTDLIANALAFGGPQPTLRLSAEARPGAVAFSVSDRGPGVPDKLVPSLFTPFHLMHRSVSPGLGLSIVGRLAAMQEGRCSYRREDGWTIFSFTLPAP